ncbi:hypothetical protein, partial [Actinoplanes philippinensis]|uniref:hypothetical protein n=1 Tax=Actinoplanes philippinensis TaxID=35752 RepID=UPI0033FC4EEE
AVLAVALGGLPDAEDQTKGNGPANDERPIRRRFQRRSGGELEGITLKVHGRLSSMKRGERRLEERHPDNGEFGEIRH